MNRVDVHGVWCAGSLCSDYSSQSKMTDKYLQVALVMRIEINLETI